MRYFIVTIALLAANPTPSVAHEHRKARCSYQGVDEASWTLKEVKATIRCAVEKFPVSESIAHYVAYRESRYNELARNPSSGACGVYQFIPSTWSNMHQMYGRWNRKWNMAEGCTNARTNILYAIRYAHAGGWGPWGI